MVARTAAAGTPPACLPVTTAAHVLARPPRCGACTAAAAGSAAGLLCCAEPPAHGRCDGWLHCTAPVDTEYVM
eukprot:COSAG01_NODE_2141_length_8319_cov_4.012406_4_plen_73_part_00